jgi:predicted dinucleotide-binding enzyme
MKIAIIGAGNVGGVLARRWVQAGNHVFIASRNPQAGKVQGLIEELAPNAEALPIDRACAAADVVLLSTPWTAAREALTQAGDLAGKVLLDATNPLMETEDGRLALIPGESAGEQVARWLPGVEVVKIFNTVGSGVMADARFTGARPVMLYATDSGRAAEIARRLGEETWFDPVHAGGIEYSAHLEHFGMIWINLALAQGHGTDIAFGLLRR